MEENEVYYINKMVTRQPLKVNVKVNGILMSEKMYRTYFPNEQLHNSNVVINPSSAKRRIYLMSFPAW